MKKRNYIIVGIILVIISMIGISFAYWYLILNQQNANRIKTGCLNFEFNEQNDISLQDAIPISDSDGEKLTPYKLTIKNSCNIDSNYVVNLEVLNTEERLSSGYLKLKVNSEDAKILSSYPTSKGIIDHVESYKIGEGRLTQNQVATYEIGIWMDEGVKVENKDSMNKTFRSKVTVEGTPTDKEEKYTEGILNGADPVLGENLIPVVIDENGGVTRANEKEKWYNYANQEWANAVILNDKEANPEVGTKIDESEIESYFVWIPRYRYKIFNEGNYNGLTTKESKEQTIQVIFETKDKEPQQGSTVGTWLTHPAFIAFNTNGIWVGKFKTGYEGAENAAQAVLNPANEEEAIEAAEKVIIKPNEYSWRGIQISKAYVIGRNYNENLQSHMMKNTEWGAVAYLQQSMYGSRQKIRINNNQSYLTGYASKYESTIGWTGGSNESCSANKDACNEYCTSEKGVDGTCNTQYFNKESVKASTTNNYSGIFDMAGGNYESMMSGVEDNITGSLLVGQNNTKNSGFNGNLLDGNKVLDGIDLPTEAKWFDIYKYSINSNDYSRRILGDATGELGPFQLIQFKNSSKTFARPYCSWDNSYASFVRNTSSFFSRGGSYDHGTEGSIFFFTTSYGGEGLSFRLVLAV